MNEQQLPDPLNTPDCDIRGYNYMSFYGDIYYSSGAYKLALKNPRAGIAAQKLWWEAFCKQVPAGSLPNDDEDLARLADFGTDLRSWNKVKATALHGFILCSDGRLYHPFVIERAKVAEKTRLGNRKRQANRRDRQQGQVIENLEFSPEDQADITRDITHDAGVTHAVVTGERKGKENKGKESTEATHSTESVPQPARVAFLNVVQGSDAPTIEAAPADPPEPVNDRNLMPRANDPPYRWVGSGLSRGPDGQPRTMLQGMVPHLVAGKPGVNRVVLDVAARNVCTAGLYAHTSKLDWNVLVDWIDEGFDVDLHIVPAIEELVARQQKGTKGYRQPGTLRYFDGPLREFVARSRAA